LSRMSTTLRNGMPFGTLASVTIAKGVFISFYKHLFLFLLF
jgi:hypothetical protein